MDAEDGEDTAAIAKESSPARMKLLLADKSKHLRTPLRVRLL